MTLKCTKFESNVVRIDTFLTSALSWHRQHRLYKISQSNGVLQSKSNYKSITYYSQLGPGYNSTKGGGQKQRAFHLTRDIHICRKGNDVTLMMYECIHGQMSLTTLCNYSSDASTYRSRSEHWVREEWLLQWPSCWTDKLGWCPEMKVFGGYMSLWLFF